MFSVVCTSTVPASFSPPNTAVISVRLLCLVFWVVRTGTSSRRWLDTLVQRYPVAQAEGNASIFGQMNRSSAQTPPEPTKTARIRGGLEVPGLVAQPVCWCGFATRGGLVVAPHRTQEVGGSNPPSSTSQKPR